MCLFVMVWISHRGCKCPCFNKCDEKLFLLYTQNASFSHVEGTWRISTRTISTNCFCFFAADFYLYDFITWLLFYFHSVEWWGTFIDLSFSSSFISISDGLNGLLMSFMEFHLFHFSFCCFLLLFLTLSTIHIFFFVSFTSLSFLVLPFFA